MIRKFLPLVAAAVVLPAVAMAAPPVRSAEIVLVPVALAPVPVEGAMPVVPAALIRQVDAMQESMQAQMAVLERLAFAPVALAPMPAPVDTSPGSYTQVSMVSVGGSGGVCNEQMEIVPGHNGRMHVFVRREGKGCAPEAAALAHGGPHATAPAPRRPHLPPNALPPPSKLLQADYAVPGRARRVG